MKSSTRQMFTINKQILIPLAALVILALYNLYNDPEFFKITLGTDNSGNPVFSGYPITILDYGSELAILAIGMTLVTAATGGQDISVGAMIAISGSALLRIMCGSDVRGEELQNPILLAFLLAMVITILFSLFNGALVAYLNIQPMIATLILFTAGRSIAAWINHSALPNVYDTNFAMISRNIPGCPIPTPTLITIAFFVVIWLLLKFTTLGLYTQTVGINEKSARLNGLNPARIKMLAFVILGICVSVAAIIKVSRVMTINYSEIAKDIEMDAILAVALGGNALSGGKFNLPSSILGAYVIQFLATTLYKYDIPPAALSAYKAIVVIILVICSAPTVRDAFNRLIKKIKTKSEKKEVSAE